MVFNDKRVKLVVFDQCTPKGIAVITQDCITTANNSTVVRL